MFTKRLSPKFFTVKPGEQPQLQPHRADHVALPLSPRFGNKLRSCFVVGVGSENFPPCKKNTFPCFCLALRGIRTTLVTLNMPILSDQFGDNSTQKLAKESVAANHSISVVEVGHS